MTFLDTAESYGNGQSETYLGHALRGRRDQVVLATKFGGGGEVGHGKGSREEIRRALEGSLERLQMDHVDLYQHHQEDPDTPLAETIGALGELVREGRIRAYGTSNYSAARLEEAASLAERRRTSRSRASTRGSSARPSASSCVRASASGSGSSRTSRSRVAC